MTRRARNRTRRRGAVAVVVTLCLIPLVGILAFTFDGGLLLASKRRTQTVADAAAHAAACMLYRNVSSDPTGLDLSGKARAAALSYASANGSNNDSTTNTVVINIPPQSGHFANTPSYVEVIVTTIQPRIFSAILGSGSLRISARAVARGMAGQSKPYSTASVVALDPNKPNALQVTGGTNLSADSPIQVNSSNNKAFTASNGVNVAAPSILVTGNYKVDNGSNVYTTRDSAVQTAVQPSPDPLASLPIPNPATMASGARLGNTFTPGVYSGGLSVSNGQNVTLQPGIYYMKGGDFSISNGVNLSGTGVTIYLDNGSKFNVQGGSNVSLTPPTTGQWAGLSLYQDRNSAAPINLGNGSNVNLAGTIYAASAALNLTGGSNTHSGSQAIVGTFNVSNGVNLAFTTSQDVKKGYVASGATSASITLVE